MLMNHKDMKIFIALNESIETDQAFNNLLLEYFERNGFKSFVNFTDMNDLCLDLVKRTGSLFN